MCEYLDINIVEARFKKKLNFDVIVCVVWWCSDGSINRQEYKSFDISAVLSRYLWLNNTIE